MKTEGNKSDSGIANVMSNWNFIERSLLAAAIVGAFVCLWRHETSIATASVERANVTAMVQEMRTDVRKILERLPPKP